jgi:hypothetical protein
MSLAPDEQRALAEIVSELRRSDPALAAMFTILIKAAGRKPTARELLPRREPTPTDRGQTRRTVLARTITLFAVCVALAIACIVLAATATSRAGPPQNGCMLGAGAAINVYSPERLFPCPLPRHLQQVIQRFRELVQSREMRGGKVLCHPVA